MVGVLLVYHSGEKFQQVKCRPLLKDNAWRIYWIRELHIKLYNLLFFPFKLISKKPSQKVRVCVDCQSKLYVTQLILVVLLDNDITCGYESGNSSLLIPLKKKHWWEEVHHKINFNWITLFAEQYRFYLINKENFNLKKPKIGK